MAFSFDTTLSILNNAVNELSRAARDLGDSQADSELSDRLSSALAELSACVDEFTAERDRRAAGGTTADKSQDVTLRANRQTVPEPGSDLPPDPPAASAPAKPTSTSAAPATTATTAKPKANDDK